MSPLLLDGDVVFIKKTGFKNVNINDLICVKKSGKIFTHRVIYRSNNFVVTKGDNNTQSDGKVFSKNLIGLVFQIIRNNQLFNPTDLYLMQSTVYFKEIVSVKKALEKEKINFLFLKGLPLHLYLEGKHPGRVYADCDLLVEEKQLAIVNKMFRRLDYKPQDSSLSEFQKKLRGKEPEISFNKTTFGFTVSFDIHIKPVFLMVQISKLNELYPNKLLDSLTKRFLNNKRYVEIDREIFPILQRSDLLVYLILHLYHHNLKGAFRFDFIENLIQKEPVNYKEVEDLIKDYKLQNFVYPGFLLLAKYYKVKFSKSFLQSIEPSHKILDFIYKNLLKISIFDDELRIEAGIERFKNLFFLSPRGFLEKIPIFFNAEVLYAVFWVFILRFRSASSQMLKR